MFGKGFSVMYQDDDFLLLYRKFFWSSWFPVCPYFVFVKHRSLLIKLNSMEKGYLGSMIANFIDLGGRPEQLKKSEVFREFCEAISARGFSIYKYYFITDADTRSREIFQRRF